MIMCKMLLIIGEGQPEVVLIPDPLGSGTSSKHNGSGIS